MLYPAKHRPAGLPRLSVPALFGGLAAAFCRKVSKGMPRGILFTGRLLVGSLSVGRRAPWPALTLLPLLASCAAPPPEPHAHDPLTWSAAIGRLDDDTRTTIYRLAQESATNAVKHAKASEFRLRLRIGERHGTALALLDLRDNGIGLPERLPRGGRGLQGMRDRVTSLGGLFRLRPVPYGAAPYYFVGYYFPGP